MLKREIVEFTLLDTTNKQVLNPGRGWYEIYGFEIEENIDFDELVWSLRDNETLALVIIGIGAFKDEAISEEAIKNLDSLLSFFIDNHKDIILRITYDREGRARNREPSFFSTVLLHMSQIGKVIKKHKNGIFTCQGMFVGNWGEMHGSDYVSGECIRRMYATLSAATEGMVTLSVRKPAQWRMVFDSEIRKPNSVAKRLFNRSHFEKDEEKCVLGLFDDGMFGSRTNLGTFGVVGRKEAKWDEVWEVSDELEFQDNLCMNAPCGGEVIWSEYSDKLSADDFVERLKKMHVTYLNCVHDERLLNKWKTMEYKGMNLYDYIGIHMGYSLVIEEFKYKTNGKSIKFAVKVKNDGFAPLYAKGIIKMTLVDAVNLSFSDKLDVDYALLPDKIYDFQFELPAKRGNIYMKMQRQSDESEIVFANIIGEKYGTYGTYIGKVTVQ